MNHSKFYYRMLLNRNVDSQHCRKYNSLIVVENFSITHDANALLIHRTLNVTRMLV